MNLQNFTVTISLAILGTLGSAVLMDSSAPTKFSHQSDNNFTLTAARHGIFDPGDHKGTPDTTRGYQGLIPHDTYF